MSGEQVGQNEIEELLRQAQGSAKPAAPPAAAPSAMSLGQDEIEALLKKGVGSPPPGAGIPPAVASRPAAAPAKPAPAAPMSSPRSKTGDDIEFLLQQAENALASVDHPVSTEVPGIAPFSLKALNGSPPSADHATLELLRDVELNVKIELGRTHMYLEDVLRLRRGSVVTLDKLAGDPVDIYVNGRLVARGEVLVLNDNFCVRVAELVAGETPVAS